MTEITKLLAQFFNVPMEIETKIGEVSPKIIERFEEIDKKKEEVRAEIKKKVKAYEVELYKQHEVVDETLREQHKQAWNDIFEELKIPESEQGKQYAIRSDNVVIRIDEEVEPISPIQ